MITTRINVKPHLKEFVIGKFNQFSDKPVRFPDQMDIYHQIFDLMVKRPTYCPVDSGNLEIILPDRKSYKHPKTYNYLGIRAQRLIEKKIENMFWSEFRDYIEHERNKKGTYYIDITVQFLKKYGISSISEDALIKHYYRWRRKTRNYEKRVYNYKKK